MKSAEALERFSLGAALKLAELERYDNAPLLHRLRTHEPVSWFAEQGVCRPALRPVWIHYA